MKWFVVHTKPRQEKRALENLERQGYTCFLPTIALRKPYRSGVRTVSEALFSRYLFVQLDTTLEGRSWAPIRSTMGVSRLVAFDNTPLPVSDALIELLRTQQPQMNEPESPYRKGDKVEITQGPFAGLEAVYDMDDGERRAFVLIELLQKSARLPLDLADIRPIS